MDSFGKTVSERICKILCRQGRCHAIQGRRLFRWNFEEDQYLYVFRKPPVSEKKRKFGRRIYVERAQTLKHISSYSWNDPKVGSPQRKTVFPETGRILSFQEDVCALLRIYRTLEIYPTHKTNMITHYKPVDFELEKELRAGILSEAT
jgi:hypothetical protein